MKTEIDTETTIGALAKAGCTATSAEETPYTRCALYKGEADDEEGKNVWWLGTLDKDTLPSVGGFPTAAAAQAEAASRGWHPIRKQAMDF